MPDLPDLEVRLRLITKDFDNRISNVESNLKGLEKQATTTGSVFKGVFGAQMVQTIGRGVFDFFKAGAQDLAEVDRLAKATEAVIRSTGGAAGVTATQVSTLSDSIEKATGKSAEMVTEAQNLLLTFTSISGDDGIFERATRAAIDMSTVFGQDASASAVQLGKALQDPIAGVSALSRVGVTFTEDQKKVIKSLVDSGDVAGAQTVILAELERQVGGAASAYGDSMAGKVEKAKNQLGNFREELAGRVIPFLTETAIPKVLDFAAAFGVGDSSLAVKTGDARSNIQKLVDYLQENIGTFDDFKVGLDRIGQSMRGVKEWALDLRESIRRLTESVGDFLAKLRSVPGNFVEGISRVVTGGSGNLRHRALGGNVVAGQPVVVGERRPELFVPSTSGRIIPSAAGGTSVSVNIYGDVTRETLPSLGRQLVGALQAGRRA